MQDHLNNFIKQNCILFLLIFVSNIVAAQNQDLFSKEKFVTNNDTLNYRMLLPIGFSESKQYPLILFLHGRGEQGNDNETQLVHGSKLFLDNYNTDQFPAIVVFPQCPKEGYWANVKKGLFKKRIGKI